MSPTVALTWGWRVRSPSVAAQAVVAWGPVARQLHARLLQMPTEQAVRLQATANAEVLVVLGAETDLPWVDGVQYAAAHEQAPALWLSTRWEPDVAADLLIEALLRHDSRAPLLLWREPRAVIPLDRQLPVTPEHLARIGAYWAGR